VSRDGLLLPSHFITHEESAHTRQTAEPHGPFQAERCSLVFGGETGGSLGAIAVRSASFATLTYAGDRKGHYWRGLASHD